MAMDTYQSYLIRMRRAATTQPWRITVRSVESEDQWHFATLQDAMNFLQAQLDNA
ncbi:MAG: hypothetical protein AAF629_07070 [Chloroflexota bacterium]